MTFFQFKSSTIAVFLLLIIFHLDVLDRIGSYSETSTGIFVYVLALKVIAGVVLVYLAFIGSKTSSLPPLAKALVLAFLGWWMIGIPYGFYHNTIGYYELKAIGYIYFFAGLSVLVVFLGANLQLSLSIVRFAIGILLLYALFYIPISLSFDSEIYPRSVIMIAFLLIFFPYVSFFSKILLLMTVVMAFILSFDYRINMLRIAFDFLLAASFYLLYLRSKHLFNASLFLVFMLPLLLMILGISDTFNVFRDSIVTDIETTAIGGGEVGGGNIAADTRTFLWVEVLGSMLVKGSSFLIGEGAGATYITYLFNDLATNGRLASETAVLNLLLNSGIIGIALFAMIVFYAAYLGINQSNNRFTKVASALIAVQWVYVFLENQFNLNLNWFFIWLMVGLVMSNNIRALTDAEISYFFTKQLSLSFKFRQ